MKDEIKEINIKRPGQILDYVDTKEYLLELFNYITNLQERIDKAIKYIDKQYWGIGDDDNIDDLLNILQGSDE